MCARATASAFLPVFVALFTVGCAWSGCDEPPRPSLPPRPIPRRVIEEPDAGPERSDCFEVGYGKNSASTDAVFAERQLQSGGPTWAAILEVLVRKHATVVGLASTDLPNMPGFGVPYRITWPGGSSWYLVDDEADGAIFCSGNMSFLGSIRVGYERANREPEVLKHLLDQAHDDLE